MLPYVRCPSDRFQPNQPYTNYVGSMGPQCIFDWCNYDPFGTYCHKPEWVTRAAPGRHDQHPQRVARHVQPPRHAVWMADVPDGTSNTLFIGESLVGQHNHLRRTDWANGWGARPTAAPSSPSITRSTRAT